MNFLLAILLSVTQASEAAERSAPKADIPSDDRACVIVVVGAAAVDEYAQPFESWADHWAAAAEKADAEFIRIGGAKSQFASSAEVSTDAQATPNDLELLHQALEQHASGSAAPLWLVLIGHGTFDGQLAKFNLVGPDLTPKQLGEWLADVSRPLAMINCASASGPFLTELSGENRVIATATGSGHELNYARFGEYISAAIDDPTADLDKDDQVSLLEAYITASKRVEEFYRTESRLATEHALLDDNGDHLGTPAEWFRGVHATRRAKDGAALDGARAHQLHLVKSQRELSLPQYFLLGPGGITTSITPRMTPLARVSPAGNQIAYLTGMGRFGLRAAGCTLAVVNLDGSERRTIGEVPVPDGGQECTSWGARLRGMAYSNDAAHVAVMADGLLTIFDVAGAVAPHQLDVAGSIVASGDLRGGSAASVRFLLQLRGWTANGSEVVVDGRNLIAVVDWISGAVRLPVDTAAEDYVGVGLSRSGVPYLTHTEADASGDATRRHLLLGAADFSRFEPVVTVDPEETWLGAWHGDDELYYLIGPSYDPASSDAGGRELRRRVLATGADELVGWFPHSGFLYPSSDGSAVLVSHWNAAEARETRTDSATLFGAGPPRVVAIPRSWRVAGWVGKDHIVLEHSWREAGKRMRELATLDLNGNLILVSRGEAF